MNELNSNFEFEQLSEEMEDNLLFPIIVAGDELVGGEAWSPPNC